MIACLVPEISPLDAFCDVGVVEVVVVGVGVGIGDSRSWNAHPCPRRPYESLTRKVLRRINIIGTMEPELISSEV